MYPVLYDYHYLLKLLIIGNTGVGKSSLLTRFADNDFRDQYIYTIGVDFKVRTLLIDGKVIKLQIWDTAGQERFRALTSSYYRGANGVVIVYDITDQSSFNAIIRWLCDIKQNTDTNVGIVLIGNKCDMSDERETDIDEAHSLAKRMAIDYIETSAKDGTNVEKAFHLIASKILASQTLNRFGSSSKLSHQRSIINISAAGNACNKCCY